MRLAEEYELQAARTGHQSAVSEPELAGQASASEPQSYNGNGVLSNTGVGSSNTLFDVDRTSLGQGTRAAEFVTNPLSAASTDAYSVPNLNYGPRDQHQHSLLPPPSTAHQTRESANTPFSTSHWGALDGTDSNLDLDMFEVNRSWYLYDAISATDPSRQHGPAIDADNAGVISPQLQGVTTAGTGSTTNAASATHQSAVIWDSGYQGRNAFGDLPMNSFNQGATALSGSPQIPGEPYTGFIAQAPRAQTRNAAPFASSIAAPALSANQNPPETIANDNFDWDYWIDQAWVGGEEPNDSKDES